VHLVMVGSKDMPPLLVCVCCLSMDTLFL